MKYAWIAETVNGETYFGEPIYLSDFVKETNRFKVSINAGEITVRMKEGGKWRKKRAKDWSEVETLAVKFLKDNFEDVEVEEVEDFPLVIVYAFRDGVHLGAWYPVAQEIYLRMFEGE